MKSRSSIALVHLVPFVFAFGCSETPATPDAGSVADGAALDDAPLTDAPLTDAPLTDAPATTDVTVGAGCGRPGATGLLPFDLSVGGATRHYQLFVPASYDGSAPLDLVFVFHGLGGDGSQIRAYLSLESVADGEALFVYPDGVAQAAAGGETAWAATDLSFLDAMIDEVSSLYCVDAERIFAMGHSYGAYMTNLVGCERGDVVRGIAAVSGGSIGGTCRGPVAAWLAHGRSDGTVPESQGLGARDGWLENNGCASTGTPTPPSPCVTYACTEGAPVTWCAFDGGHFPLPAFTRPAIWDFFSAL